MAARMFDRDIQAASLDHAMWFHRAAPARRLAALHAGQPVGAGARGFTRGALYAEDGTLIASVARKD